MKKILVPTDFSPVANNAMSYAIELAAAFNSELLLYHAYSFDRFNYDLSYPDEEQPFIKEVERKMKLAELRFKNKAAQNQLSLKTIIKQRNILSLFQSDAKEDGIDLIVMGTKGATGLEKVIFGSVAAAALAMTKVPVLVVPPEQSFQPLQHIVLAVDHKETDGEVLSPLRALASKYETKITLLNVNKQQNDNVHRKLNIPGLEGLETTYQEVPFSNSINETINDFITKADCDLLCMIKREKGFFESIFSKSVAKEQSYNSQVALLILPEKR